MRTNVILSLASALFLAGCSMAPKYVRPPAPVSATWPSGQSAEGTAADVPWNEFFRDPRLVRLIELGLENNRDFRVAALRVEQTRAQYRIQRAGLFPDLIGGASASRQRTPSTVSVTGGAMTTTAYNVNVGAAFELDLFGRVRSLKEEALQRYFATDAARRALQIALISEIATQYLTTLQLDEALALAQQTLAAVQKSYDLNKASFDAGVASELDFRTAEAQVENAKVSVATYAQLRAESENALTLLVGQSASPELPAGRTLREQGLLANLPAGVPSDLLQRRPDIIGAEHELKAANANIGAARAAFFPRITLTGSAGTASAKLTDLFTGPSAAWSFAPQITVPIFEGGRNRANLDVAELQKEIEVATYEKAIQTAFREVADALAAREFVEQKIASQNALVAALEKRFELTTARHRQGVDNYVEVLLAQQDLYAAQQTLIQFQSARLINAVELYRSLGGGWSERAG